MNLYMCEEIIFIYYYIFYYYIFNINKYDLSILFSLFVLISLFRFGFDPAFQFLNQFVQFVLVKEKMGLDVSFAAPRMSVC